MALDNHIIDGLVKDVQEYRPKDGYFVNDTLLKSGLFFHGFLLNILFDQIQVDKCIVAEQSMQSLSTTLSSATTRLSTCCLFPHRDS